MTTGAGMLLAGSVATNALEFVEVYNSNPFEEEIGGYRIKGEIDFTFPEGTVLAGQSDPPEGDSDLVCANQK